MTRTMTSLSVLLLLAVGRPALAVEDHAVVAAYFTWIPTDGTSDSHPEIGPYKDHYFHEIAFDRRPNGRFQVKIKLPDDLSAGRERYVTLQETDSDPGEGLYSFGGTQLVCSVGDSWTDGGCDVHLYPLTDIPESELRAYAEHKYRGSHKQVGMGSVAALVSTEPFGTIGLTEPDQVHDGALQGNGTWQTRRQRADGSWVEEEMTVDFSRGVFAAPTAPVVGLLSGFYYVDNVVDGGWGFSDEDFGWFRFTIEGDTFDGVWGTWDDTDTPLGRWTGTR